MVNHLWTTHYHLDLDRAHCLDYFTTSADVIHWHAQLCKPTAVGYDDNDKEEENYEDDDNSNEDNELMFEED